MVITPVRSRQERKANTARRKGDFWTEEVGHGAGHQREDAEQAVQDGICIVASVGVQLATATQGGQNIEHSHDEEMDAGDDDALDDCRAVCREGDSGDAVSFGGRVVCRGVGVGIVGIIEGFVVVDFKFCYWGVISRTHS